MACDDQDVAAKEGGEVLDSGRRALLQSKPAVSASYPDDPRADKILPLAEVERQTILNALQQLNGNKLRTARVLGIGKTTLYRKLKEYGICVP